MVVYPRAVLAKASTSSGQGMTGGLGNTSLWLSLGAEHSINIAIAVSGTTRTVAIADIFQCLGPNKFPFVVAIAGSIKG
jgi:hypothetical protein